MAIEAPKERVYYYECSRGTFRLVRFIPPEELKALRRTNDITAQAVKDFPDGVDLGCTEPDFAELEATYGYRPPEDPQALRAAFYAIFTSTRGWRTFRGSGFIPASDLEAQIDRAARAVKKAKKAPLLDRLPVELSLKKRRRELTQRASQTRYAQRALEKIRIKGLDPRRTIREQSFSPYKRTKGKKAEEVFMNLLQKKAK